VATAASSTAMTVSLFAGRIFRAQSASFGDDFLGDLRGYGHGLILFHWAARTTAGIHFEVSRANGCARLRRSSAKSEETEKSNRLSIRLSRIAEIPRLFNLMVPIIRLRLIVVSHATIVV
jgi:hypothetical protein